MERRRLGKTNLEVSLLGIGGIPFQRVDAKTTTEILRRALELGVNFIDTARGYTVSENYIGQALREVGREHFVLATKSMRRDAEGLLEEFAVSQQELQSDYIELYQFHNLRSLEEYEKMMGPGGAYFAARTLVEEGKVGHLGLTTHRTDVLEAAILSGQFATVQFPYNLMETQGEKLFQEALARDQGLIVMKPFAGGAIMNKGLSLRFLAENQAVSSIIPGVDSIEQLEQNAKDLAHREPLNEKDLRQIEEEARQLGEHFCRRCGYCLPCTAEIDIPFMFLMEGYYSRYHLKEWSKERYALLPKQAKDCIECGLCESRCPYDLPIIEMMKKVDRVLG